MHRLPFALLAALIALAPIAQAGVAQRNLQIFGGSSSGVVGPPALQSDRVSISGNAPPGAAVQVSTDAFASILATVRANATTAAWAYPFASPPSGVTVSARAYVSAGVYIPVGTAFVVNAQPGALSLSLAATLNGKTITSIAPNDGRLVIAKAGTGLTNGVTRATGAINVTATLNDGSKLPVVVNVTSGVVRPLVSGYGKPGNTLTAQSDAVFPNGSPVMTRQWVRGPPYADPATFSTIVGTGTSYTIAASADNGFRVAYRQTSADGQVSNSIGVVSTRQAFGVYTGSSVDGAGQPYGPAFAQILATYLGRPVDFVEDFSNIFNWSGFVSSSQTSGQNAWKALTAQNPNLGMLWTMGIANEVVPGGGTTFTYPQIQAGSPLDNVTNGNYDTQYNAVFDYLLAANYPGGVRSRLLHEANLGYAVWSVFTATVPKYISAFQHIVTLGRYRLTAWNAAHPNDQRSSTYFQFIYCPNKNAGNAAPDATYPGDAYVDEIAIDNYDDSFQKRYTYDRPGNYTAQTLGQGEIYVAAYYGSYAGKWLEEFGTLHKKPIAFTEWGGGFRGDQFKYASPGDNPVYVQEVNKRFETYAGPVGWSANWNGYIADYKTRSLLASNMPNSVRNNIMRTSFQGTGSPTNSFAYEDQTALGLWDEMPLSAAAYVQWFGTEAAQAALKVPVPLAAPTITSAGATGVPAGTADFLISASTPTNKILEVVVQTQDGTAVAGTDYTALAATRLYLNPGDLPYKIPVPILAGATSGRTFSLKLAQPTSAEDTSNPSNVYVANYTLGTTTATGTVGAPTLGTPTLTPAQIAAGFNYSGTIAGKTNLSTITATSSDGTTLTVSGTGTTATITGTFSTQGMPTITLTETLAGATRSPKATKVPFDVTVRETQWSSMDAAAAATPITLSNNAQTALVPTGATAGSYEGLRGNKAVPNANACFEVNVDAFPNYTSGTPSTNGRNFFVGLATGGTTQGTALAGMTTFPGGIGQAGYYAFTNVESNERAAGYGRYVNAATWSAGTRLIYCYNPTSALYWTGKVSAGSSPGTGKVSWFTGMPGTASGAALHSFVARPWYPVFVGGPGSRATLIPSNGYAMLPFGFTWIK